MMIILISLAMIAAGGWIATQSTASRLPAPLAIGGLVLLLTKLLS